MVDPNAFDPNVDPRRIASAFVTKKFGVRFGNEQLTESMRSVDRSAEARSWREIRNVLSHRCRPVEASTKAVLSWGVSIG